MAHANEFPFIDFSVCNAIKLGIDVVFCMQEHRISQRIICIIFQYCVLGAIAPFLLAIQLLLGAQAVPAKNKKMLTTFHLMDEKKNQHTTTSSSLT